MLNIYNIYKTLILEEKKLLVESVTRQDIINAIDSNYRYRIWYQGESETTPKERLVDFYVVGRSKAGNDVARVYQPFGFTTSFNSKWQLVRLDRITRMEKTCFKLSNKPIDSFSSEIPPFNKTGDKLMTSVYYIKKFNEYAITNNTITN